MSYTVPTLSVVFMALNVVLALAIPIGLYLYFKKKRGCSPLAFFTGCGVMLLFALLLEQFAHLAVFSSALGAIIQSSALYTALYGGFMAALFEEGGRFTAFRFLLKKQRGNDENALFYGAGHGGFELMYLLFIGMLNNLIYAILLNTGNASLLLGNLSGDTLASSEAAFSQLASLSPWVFLLSLWERLSALIVQMSLSVFVWFAVKKGGKAYLLLPLAFLLHFALDTGAVLLNSLLNSTALTECCIFAFALLTAALARFVYKKNREPLSAS